jgi:hypothetical protein
MCCGGKPISAATRSGGVFLNAGSRAATATICVGISCDCSRVDDDGDDEEEEEENTNDPTVVVLLVVGGAAAAAAVVVC